MSLTNEMCGLSANIVFKSYGDICHSSWSSSLLDELSKYKSDSNNNQSSVLRTSSDTLLIQMRDQQT